ncbi:SGNH/GDSL hydrolase family protein [Reichenbachiella sp. MALMAid0571]|uniref:SGNH/GDSL hydrolase family protein n=1 Tax=Reichenbachiella sp. MALMAid0571 TaxID=3143939 RepID=UPI0032DE5466
MRHVILILTILLGIKFTGTAQDDYKIPENTKKILFLGNSITYAGSYVSYIEAYLTLRYPEKHYEFINVGLPSETVSGLSEPNHAGGKFPRPDLHERLQRVLDQTKPDLVFANYGMNDGIYLPFDDSRFQKYRDGLNWLNEQVTNAGVSIVYSTPPIFDERKGAAYANVLDIYSDWLISCRYTQNWDVVDLHWPMRKYLEDQRLTDSTFVFANDGVHPNKLGHWVMAKQVLLFLGEQDLINVEDAESAMSSMSNGVAVLKLVEERQAMMKDAWLTKTGHERPGMKTGLPMKEAKKKAAEIEGQIRLLLK